MSRIAAAAPSAPPPTLAPVASAPPPSRQPPSAGPRFQELLAGGGVRSTPPTPSPPSASGAVPLPGLADVLGRAARTVAAAGARFDGALRQVKRGGLGPDQLLQVQVDVYEAGATLQLAGKLVEKTTGGLKQILQTQV